MEDCEKQSGYDLCRPVSDARDEALKTVATESEFLGTVTAKEKKSEEADYPDANGATQNAIRASGLAWNEC